MTCVEERPDGTRFCPGNGTIEAVNLSSNCIGVEGVRRMLGSLAPALDSGAVPKHLQLLALHRNPFCGVPEMVEAVAGAAWGETTNVSTT